MKFFGGGGDGLGGGELLRQKGPTVIETEYYVDTPICKSDNPLWFKIYSHFKTVYLSFLSVHNMVVVSIFWYK